MNKTLCWYYLLRNCYLTEKMFRLDSELFKNSDSLINQISYAYTNYLTYKEQIKQKENNNFKHG